MTRNNPTTTTPDPKPRTATRDVFTEARQLKNRLDALDRKKAEAIAEASTGARELVEALARIPGGLEVLDVQAGENEEIAT